jgi:hypothetical protein
MPKSRRGKGKHYHYSKKSKALRRQGMPQAGAAVSPAAPGMPEAPPAVAPGVAPPVMKAAAPVAKAAANPDPYIIGELRRISIIVGIIIVILVVLSFVIS